MIEFAWAVIIISSLIFAAAIYFGFAAAFDDFVLALIPMAFLLCICAFAWALSYVQK